MKLEIPAGTPRVPLPPDDPHQHRRWWTFLTFKLLRASRSPWKQKNGKRPAGGSGALVSCQLASKWKRTKDRPKERPPSTLLPHVVPFAVASLYESVTSLMQRFWKIPECDSGTRRTVVCQS